MSTELGLRPENLEFSGLQDRVPRQQVLRTWDEGRQADNFGFLAWHASERLVVIRTATGPLALSVLHSRSRRRDLGVSFPPPTLCHVAVFNGMCALKALGLLFRLVFAIVIAYSQHKH